MKKIDHYLCTELLGKGQFGSVYKAIDEITKKTVAIKIVSKSSLLENKKVFELFKSEICTLSKLKHPNIIHLYEYIESTNNYYLVLNYCNNGDLQDYLEKIDDNRLGEKESVYFLMQILNGFTELHKHKIMHRDVKLANIFLHNDCIVIGDFGFCKAGAEFTKTVLGSVFTMAPEVLFGGSSNMYTNKADLWSVGVCFWNLIYGEIPWDFTQIKRDIIEKSGKNLVFPAEPIVSDACKDLLIRMLEKDPEKRIAWDECLNHELFYLYFQGKLVDSENFSRLEKNLEHKVCQLFKQNMKSSSLNINIKFKITNEIKSTNEVQKIYDSIKQLIFFIVGTAKDSDKLRASLTQYPEFSQKLLTLSMFMLKQGILINKIAIESLLDKKNSFKIDAHEFEKFLLNSPEKIRQICNNFKNYKEKCINYMELLQNLMTNNAKEKIISQMEISMLIEITLETNYQEIKKRLNELIELLPVKLKDIDEKLNKKIKFALSKVYLCLKINTFFRPTDKNISFNWNTFYKKIEDTYLKIFERARREITN